MLWSVNEIGSHNKDEQDELVHVDHCPPPSHAPLTRNITTSAILPLTSLSLFSYLLGRVLAFLYFPNHDAPGSSRLLPSSRDRPGHQPCTCHTQKWQRQQERAFQHLDEVLDGRGSQQHKQEQQWKYGHNRLSSLPPDLSRAHPPWLCGRAGVHHHYDALLVPHHDPWDHK